MLRYISHLTGLLLLVPGVAWAQRDMMGFDLLALLSAVPQLILHAAAEFAIALIAVAVLLGIAGWLVARFARNAGAWRNRLPFAPVLESNYPVYGVPVDRF